MSGGFRFWPQSLQGQVLLAIAMALLLAQGLSAVLLYRAQEERRDAAVLGSAAMRLVIAERGRLSGMNGPPQNMHDRMMRRTPVTYSHVAPVADAEHRRPHDEVELARLLSEQGIVADAVVVATRDVADDPDALRRLAQRPRFGNRWHNPGEVLVAGYRRPDGEWTVAKPFIPRHDPRLLGTLLLQTGLLFLVLFGATALILRRITRPLAALTKRVEAFGRDRDTNGQLEPEGPDDVRRLIFAQNALEGRIAALLDEKDVMLGAIGHDLKTPLAALRVRIESVEDDTERRKMAATIEDIARSLDDILSLARVGRPSDPREVTDLAALVASVVEEFEDLGEPVSLVSSPQHLAVPLRQTWLKRALRNLVSNALRYGAVARVTLERDGAIVRITIDDDGSGIAEADLARMLEPFVRGEPSRNSATGGAGLGLTLARAIAEQHGGSLVLANRTNANGTREGLRVKLSLPLS